MNKAIDLCEGLFQELNSDPTFYKQRRDEWKRLSDELWKLNVRIAEISNIETAALLEDHTDSLLDNLALERVGLELQRRDLEVQRDELKAQFWKSK